MTITRHFKDSAILPPQHLLDFIHEVEPAVVVILPISIINAALERYQGSIGGFDHNVDGSLIRMRPANKQEILQHIIREAIIALVSK